jgi:hypothetical protein
MLSPDDKEIIKKVLLNDKLKDKLLNETFRGEYARGKGMMGGQLKTVMNAPIQQGMPSISATGGRVNVRKISLDDLEGQGLMDFIKKAIDVGKNIYGKVAPFVDVAKKGVEIIGTTKDAIKNLRRKEGDQTGFGMKKTKTLDSVLKGIINKKGGKKVKSQIVPVEVMDDAEGMGFKTQVIGQMPNLKKLTGGRKVNKWIQFLQSKKIKVKDIPKKGTQDYNKFMKEYSVFKSS